MDPSLNDETPKKRTMTEEKTRKTPLTTPKNFARYLLLSNNQSFTPSPSSFGGQQRVVRNPFESQLHERLLLPVISSPSLFNCLTPKKFEWSIDEISQLHPVNMKPHETQFVEDLDPQTEAQAQAAISSFFNDHKIVPSPIDCALRRQKITLKTEDMNILNSTSLLSVTCTKAEFSTKPRTRDASTQSAISFPPILPKEVEDMLKKYRFADNSDEVESSDKELNQELDTSMMDISTLRRKLFILRPETPETDEYLGYDSQNLNLSPAPRTPELTRCDDTSGASQKNESYTSDMFGELSPIQPCTPVSSNDVSMLSEYGNDKTPSRRQICKRFKKKGKNLSESFCFLSAENEFKENNEDRLLSESFDRPKRFARFDSGFADREENSKLADLMQ